MAAAIQQKRNSVPVLDNKPPRTGPAKRELMMRIERMIRFADVAQALRNTWKVFSKDIKLAEAEGEAAGGLGSMPDDYRHLLRQEDEVGHLVVAHRPRRRAVPRNDSAGMMPSPCRRGSSCPYQHR